jgi:OOP family OmpA-OmpF porin
MEAVEPLESCGTKITLSNQILFAVEQAKINDEAKDTLKSVASVLKQGKVPSVKVYGHTDSVNSDEENQILSEERAQAVSEYLENQGVSSLIDSEGMGEKQPVAKESNGDGSDNPAGRAQNRRVEIFVPTF